MSGKISGVKTRIKKINPQIVFVNCDNYSLYRLYNYETLRFT